MIWQLDPIEFGSLWVSALGLPIPQDSTFLPFQGSKLKKNYWRLKIRPPDPGQSPWQMVMQFFNFQQDICISGKNLTETSFTNDWHLTSGCRLQTAFLVQSWRPWWRPAAVTRVTNLGAGGLCTIQWKTMHVCLCQCRGLLDLRPFGRFNVRYFFMFLRGGREMMMI